jgi:hypothetical protein
MATVQSDEHDYVGDGQNQRHRADYLEAGFRTASSSMRGAHRVEDPACAMKCTRSGFGEPSCPARRDGAEPDS